MKYPFSSPIRSLTQFLLAITIFAACQSKQEHNHILDVTETKPAADTIKKSIAKEEHAMVADAHITIKYHAPAVRGRQIWVGLVPYGEVWVTGAHSATSFEINKDFIVNGKIIPAGKYAIFTIPGKDKWTFIINKNWDQHLADEYNQQDDMLRLQLNATLEETLQERLRYSITTLSDKEATLTIAWEKIKLTIPILIQ